MARFANIVRRGYEDVSPLLLGVVERVDGKDVDEARIAALWDEFQEMQPDTDSQFLELLSEHGYSSVPSHDSVDVVVG